MLAYLIWVPIIAAFYFLYGWLSIKNNQVGETGMWFWIIIACGLFPGWAIISRISNSVVFDAVMYDVFMHLGCLLALIIYSNELSNFSTTQIVGFCTALAGFALFKFG